MGEKEKEKRSECCDAPVTWAYDGPICNQCGKWAVTKTDPPEVSK